MNNTQHHFFLIDDDEMFLYITKDLIEEVTNGDANVEYFSDAEKAFNEMQRRLAEGQNIPTSILLDLNMPFMDGWDFLSELAPVFAEHDRIPKVYILTSSTLQLDREMVNHFSSVYGFYVKPVGEDDIKSIIRDIQKES